jgi:hypothetical protein
MEINNFADGSPLLGSDEPHSVEDIPGDALLALIWPLRHSVEGGADVSGRGAQAIGPPTSGRIEDKILFRTGIDGRRINASIECTIWALCRPGGDNF